MLVQWVDPTPANTCGMCVPFVGYVFDWPDVLPLPAHYGCQCFYALAAPGSEVRVIDWARMPAETRQRWQQRAMQMVRDGERVPGLLLPLLDGEEQMSSSRQALRLESGGVEAAGSSGQRWRARLARAGRVTSAGKKPGRLVLEAGALEQAANAGMFNGVPMMVDHPGFFDTPSLRSMAAVVVFGAWDGEAQAVMGEFELYDNEPGRFMAETLREMYKPGLPVPDVGLSMVCYPVLAEGEDGRVLNITHVDSVDFVFAPAADGRVLARLSAMNQESHEERGEIVMADDTVVQPDAGSAVAEWQKAYVQSVVAMKLAASGLPAVVQAKLSAMEFDVPAAVDVAIESERQMLAALAADGVVQIGGAAPRGNGGRIQFGPTPEEDITNAVDWVFGAPGAKLPVPSLRNTREIYFALSGDWEWQGRFRPERVMLASATTTTLSDLAVNAMNKVLVPLWDSLMEYRWFEPLVTVQPHDGSTHPMAWIQFGGLSNLSTVAEGAPYTELTVADSKESDNFVKYGNYVGITEEMLRKSQLARIQAVPRELARAAVRTRSAKIANIFTQNSGLGPTLDDDSVALFNLASHANYATTAWSWTAWKAARLECYKQTELGSGKRQGIWAKYALLPGDLYDDALVDFGYGAGPGGKPGTGDNDVNPYAQTRTPHDARGIPVAVPDFTDTNNWYWLADPMLMPVLQMAYEQAPGGGVHPLPELWVAAAETAGLMFANDTLPIKVRDWFSYGVSGWRGIGGRVVT